MQRSEILEKPETDLLDFEVEDYLEDEDEAAGNTRRSVVSESALGFINPIVRQQKIDL